MTTSARVSETVHRTSATVVTCYDLLHVCAASGVSDLTEGKYAGDLNDDTAYIEAQRRQAVYLLDEIGCDRVARILDIGCGYGRVLAQARERAAAAVGITVSPPQVAWCRSRGLDVEELDYREIGHGWDGSFDGIVANGSLEHFAQISDALADRVDSVYDGMFALCHRLLRPRGRFVTTAIHFSRSNQVRPQDMAQGPHSFARGTPEYHFSMILERTFGGWLPEPGQLEQCAAPYFHLVREEDGTQDYCRTSEYWLRRIRRSTAFRPAVGWRLLRTFARRPRPTIDMLRCLVWDQSWMWQFRPPAPTRLLRHTWQRKE